MGFTGWKLPRDERARLLRVVKPTHAEVIGDHVTYEGAEDDPPIDIVRGRVVGVADDGKGVQALVVELGGTTQRPDGSTYHITWSLGPGRRAIESNDVLRTHGWREIDPIAIRISPVGVIRKPAPRPSLLARLRNQMRAWMESRHRPARGNRAATR